MDKSHRVKDWYLPAMLLKIQGNHLNYKVVNKCLNDFLHYDFIVALKWQEHNLSLTIFMHLTSKSDMKKIRNAELHQKIASSIATAYCE